MGDFVLTDSAQFELIADITQSLAGRVGRVELLPLSQNPNTNTTRGALFEYFVVSELIEHLFNQGQASDFYFWRDSTGHELNVLLDTPAGLQAIEIKSGSTFAAEWFKGLQK